jgi:hypothetical protein
VLSIRFDPATGKTVMSCQNAFIRGRNIMDGVMSLHVIFHQGKKKKKKQGVVFKIDFDKAYGKINSYFLVKSSELSGFSDLVCYEEKLVV